MRRRETLTVGEEPPLASFPSDNLTGPSGTVRPHRVRGAESVREGGVRVCCFQPLRSNIRVKGTKTHAYSRELSVPVASPADASAALQALKLRGHLTSLYGTRRPSVRGLHHVLEAQKANAALAVHAQKKKEYPEEFNTERSSKSVRREGWGRTGEAKLFRSPKNAGLSATVTVVRAGWE